MIPRQSHPLYIIHAVQYTTQTEAYHHPYPSIWRSWQRDICVCILCTMCCTYIFFQLENRAGFECKRSNTGGNSKCHKELPVHFSHTSHTWGQPCRRLSAAFLMLKSFTKKVFPSVCPDALPSHILYSPQAILVLFVLSPLPNFHLSFTW